MSSIGESGWDLYRASLVYSTSTIDITDTVNLINSYSAGDDNCIISFELLLCDLSDIFESIYDIDVTYDNASLYLSYYTNQGTNQSYSRDSGSAAFTDSNNILNSFALRIRDNTLIYATFTELIMISSEYYTRYGLVVSSSYPMKASLSSIGLSVKGIGV